LNAPAPKRRSWLGLLIPVVLTFAALIALGTWQIERKAWKEDLIAALTERLAAPPVALPPAAATVVPLSEGAIQCPAGFWTSAYVRWFCITYASST